MKYFITIGDANYLKYIEASVCNVARFHPDGFVIVYDWGFTNLQREALKRYNNVDLIKWKFIKNPYPRSFAASNRKEWLLAQKPYCFLDFALQCRKPFVFLDGDAYLVKPVPELFKSGFDIAVTLRRPDERDYARGRCRVVNSGVFAMRDLSILDKWIERMQTTDERLVEQTALTRLLYEDGLDINIKELPCEQYNFYWIDRALPPDVKVVHYKGKGVKDRSKMKRLIK